MKRKVNHLGCVFLVNEIHYVLRGRARQEYFGDARLFGRACAGNDAARTVTSSMPFLARFINCVPVLCAGKSTSR